MTESLTVRAVCMMIRDHHLFLPANPLDPSTARLGRGGVEFTASGVP